MLNKIYNEDCITGIKRIDDNSVDLVIIDPPYLINTSNFKGKSDLTIAVKKYNKELRDCNLTNGYDISILDELVRVMKKINIYIFCNGAQIPLYINYFVEKLKCKMEILIWNKNNAMPLYNHKYLSDKEYCLYFRKGGYCNPSNYDDAKTVYIHSINIMDKKKWHHPTIKPEGLIRKLIRNSSHENDLVLDCFMGSGTTAVCSILENRNYLGFEINKDFYNTCLKRIEKAKKEKEELN